MRRIAALTSIILFFCYIKLLLPLPALAESYQIPASADTMAKSGYPASNYGAETILSASDYSTNNEILSYLKFDLSNIPSTITQAQLIITAALDRSIKKEITLLPNTTWSESTLTWNNKPEIGNIIGSIDRLSNPVANGEVLSITLDPEAVNTKRSMILGLGIKNTSTSNTLSYYSKESNDPPLLIVSTDNLPSTQLPGDANGDGVVNIQDYVILSNQFGQTGALSADFNNDQVVNIQDYVILSNNFGNTLPSPTPTSTPPPSPTATPSPQPSSTPLPSPSPSGQLGIWTTSAELSVLPMAGTAWSNLLASADDEVLNPDLDVRDDKNTDTLAKALVFARDPNQTCGNYNGANCRQQVLGILQAVLDSEKGGGNDNLAVLRNTYAYVIAADLIDLKNYNPQFNSTFSTWLSELLTFNLTGGGGCDYILECHEVRPNNFGGHAAASHIAIARYLNDQAELNYAAQIHKGWLGDRSSYSNFSYQDLSWQADPNAPVGINPAGSTILIDGAQRNVDGVLPDDQRRQLEHGCPVISWPPCKEDYVWEGLQGAVVATEMLWRAGYDSYNWEDQAIKRAFDWLHTPHFAGNTTFPADGDDEWQPWIINKRYGTNYPAPVSNSIGKGMGFASWTHQ